ncbi:hypothetical protein [Nonomuraea sp. NPDC049158]|uniref:hypothetical protein n=1 Tax=Nonomuraea sp. NPDC049158 TaxID=3155649 RepID=UPI0034113874
MSPLIIAALPITLFVVVMGATIGITRLVNARRTTWGLTVVVDRRTFRDARARLDGLLADGDDVTAFTTITTMRTWLRNEIHTGPRRHRVRNARHLELLELHAENVRARLQDESR